MASKLHLALAVVLLVGLLSTVIEGKGDKIIIGNFGHGHHHKHKKIIPIPIPIPMGGHQQTYHHYTQHYGGHEDHGSYGGGHGYGDHGSYDGGHASYGGHGY